MAVKADAHPSMTPTELADAIKSLGLPSGYALAKRIGVTPRTVQKWLAGKAPIPQPVAMLVRMMLEGKGNSPIGNLERDKGLSP